MNMEQWESKLLDYFSGTLSLSERQEVEGWIGQSEELNDIKQINAPRAFGLPIIRRY